MPDFPSDHDYCENKHGGNPESVAAHKKSLRYKRERLLRILVACMYPKGITCREASESWGIPMHSLSGYFTELKARGLIRKLEVRNGGGAMVTTFDPHRLIAEGFHRS